MYYFELYILHDAVDKYSRPWSEIMFSGQPCLQKIENKNQQFYPVVEQLLATLKVISGSNNIFVALSGFLEWTWKSLQ